MDEKYLQDLYEWIKSNDSSYEGRYSYDQFKQKIQDENYASQMHKWISGIDNTFEERRPLDAFIKLVKQPTQQPMAQEQQPVKKKEDWESSWFGGDGTSESEPSGTNLIEKVNQFVSSQQPKEQVKPTEKPVAPQDGRIAEGYSWGATTPTKLAETKDYGLNITAPSKTTTVSKEAENLIKEQNERNNQERLNTLKETKAFELQEQEKRNQELSDALFRSKTPEFINKLNSIDNRIFDYYNNIDDLKKEFQPYGIVIEKAGIFGNKLIARSENGQASVDIDLSVDSDADKVQEAKKLRDFISQNNRMSEEEDFLNKALRAKNMRNGARINDDGTMSTVKFVSFDNKVIPTLFPKNPLFVTPFKDDWVELPFEEALKEAQKRGEIFTFKTDKEAQDFASGSWKDMSKADLEGDLFYKQKGLDYVTDKRRINRYNEIDDIINFFEGGELSAAEKEKVYSNPSVFINGKKRLDVANTLEELKKEREQLRPLVKDMTFRTQDKTYEKTRMDFDVHLAKIENKTAAEATKIFREAKSDLDIVKAESISRFNMPIEELMKIPEDKITDKEAYKNLVQKYTDANQLAQTAAMKFDEAKTYFDAKTNKEINSELTDNLLATWNSLNDGLTNGMIGDQLLAMTLPGYTSYSGYSDPKNAAKYISEKLASMSGTQSRVMTRMSEAKTYRDWWDVVLDDPFEAMAVGVAQSVSQMLPYGVKIIPTTTLTGAGTGAVAGLLGGPFAPITVTGGATTGAVTGFKSGQAITGYMTEYTNALMEAVKNNGYNALDPESLEKALNDQNVWNEGAAVGAARGIPIAVVDYVTAGLAGKMIKPASKLASATSKIARGTVENVIIDPSAEMAGELVAQGNEILFGTGRKEIDFNEVALEGIGSMGTNTPNYVLNSYSSIKKNTDINLAYNLTDYKNIASEKVSDERISNWANNMQRLGKIDEDVNQKIQENVGLRREAKELMSVGGGSANSNVTSRTMELLAAKKELTSSKEKQEVYSDDVKAINEELSAMGKNKAILPTENQVDLTKISGIETKEVGEYMINGRRYTKQQFLDKIDSFTPERLAKLNIGVKNDDQVSQTLNEKLDAIQKQAAGEVSVQSETGISQEMVEGEPETGPKAAPIQGVLSPEESQRKEELLAAFENPSELESFTEGEPTPLIKVNDAYEDKAGAQAELDALLQKEQATPEGLGAQIEIAAKEGQETAQKTTTDIITSAPLNIKGGVIITDSNGNDVVVNDNEQIAAKLYDDAMATPEDQRTPNQNDIIEKVQRIISQVAAETEVTPVAETAPVEPAETFTEQDRARKQELTDALAKADKRRKNVIVGETVMTKADVKAELDALNQKELSSQQPVTAPVTEVAPVQTLTPEQEADKLEQMMLAKMGAPKVEAAPLTEQAPVTETPTDQAPVTETVPVTEVSPTTETAPAETFFKSVQVSPQIKEKKQIIDIEKVKEKLSNAYEFLKKYKGHENFTPQDVRNALAIAYNQMMRFKSGAENLLSQIKELEELVSETSPKRTVTKEEFKKQLRDSGDFTKKQLAIFDALVDSLNTDTMPEYNSNEKSLEFVGINVKNSPNFYSFVDNILSAKSPAAFIHEIGHFAFYNILSKEDRISFLEGMIDTFYGQGKPTMKSKVAMTSEKVTITKDGKTFEFSTNVGDNFSEYFAEQFRQWYLKEKTTPKQFDTIFEKVEKFLEKLINKLRTGEYIDKNLIKYFEKIINNKSKPSTKTLSDAVRSLKIKGPGGLQSNILGVPIAIWNAAVETVATAIDAGKGLADQAKVLRDAIAKGYAEIKEKYKAINKERYEAKVLNRMYSGAIEMARNPVDPRDKISDAGIKSYLMRKGLTESQADALLKIKPKAEKKPISKEKIVGKPKPKKVTVNEMTALKDQIRLEARAAREAKGDLNKKRKMLIAAINEMKKKGSISVRQAKALINRVNSVNLDNPVMVERLLTYAEKVFNDAEYADKLNKANDLQSDIKKLSRNTKKFGNLTPFAAEFAKIDPAMVENIDEYIEMASNVKEGVQGSKIVRGNVVPADMVDVGKTMEYVNKMMEAQAETIRKNTAERLQELMGVDASDLTYDQMMELLNLSEDEKVDKYKEGIIRGFINKMFNTYSTIINDMFETGIDPFSDPDNPTTVEFKESDKKIVEEFMAMDLSLLDAKEALRAADALNNFIVNKSIAGMEGVLGTYRGRKNVKEVYNKGVKSREIKMYFSPAIGRLFFEQFASVPLFFERLFKGFKAGQYVREKMGINSLINHKAEALDAANRVINKYVLQFTKMKPNKKSFQDMYNIIERGIIGDLAKTIVGDEKQVAAEFNRRKKLIEESIEVLNKGGTKKETQAAKVIKEVYDKIARDANNIAEVKANADQINVDAVQFWVDEWAKLYDQFADVALSVYNKVLDKNVNYIPDRFGFLERADKVKKDTDGTESLFFSNSNTENFYKKEAGSLMKSTPPTSLFDSSGKANMYVNLSFDTNNANALLEALIDIKTAADIRQIQAFTKSPEFENIIPSGKDASLTKDRIATLIRNIRNKRIVTDKVFRDVTRKLDRAAALGTALALAGPTQAISQTVPVAVNTFINSGGNLNLSVLNNKAVNDFMNNSGMGIANRGADAATELETLNQKLEAAATSKTEKAARAIENINRLYLKVFLSNFDVMIARASWMTYYEKSLRKQGINTKNIDYSTHKMNKDAAQYAQDMVDRQQNISDKDLAGKMYQSDNPLKQFITKVVMPLTTFRMNQTTRFSNDLAVLSSKTASNEDKAIARRSLGGFAAEMATFRLVKLYIGYYVFYSIAQFIRGEEDDEEEKKKKWDNMVKGAATSATTDVFSPIPITDIATNLAVNTILDQMQAIMGMDQEERYNIFTEKNKTPLESFISDLGLIGIAVDKATKLYENIRLGVTGKFTDNYGNEKTIMEKDRELLSNPLYIALGITTTLGINPFSPETNNVMNTIVKSAKKDAMTGEQLKEYQETGRTKSEAKKYKAERKAMKEEAYGGYETLEEFEKNDPEKFDEYSARGGKLYKYRESERLEEEEKNKDKPFRGLSEKKFKELYPREWRENYGPGTEYFREQNTPEKRRERAEEKREEAKREMLRKRREVQEKIRERQERYGR